MTHYKVLVEMDFGHIISEASAQTQTGAELLSKYQSYLLANPESCGVVNQFVREAAQHRYDNGINEALGRVADYIQSCKTSWALASACESIQANQSKNNILNRNAARQVEKLLEQSEENVVKYIQAGSLKNVMFCESFRTIAKQVFAGRTIVESKADYTKHTPVSMVESVADGHCFVVAGHLYKIDDAKNITEAAWTEVSNTFKVVESLLEARITTIDESGITVNYGDVEFHINEDKITRKQGKQEREFTVEQFRDNSRLVLMTANPRRRAEYAQVLEAIALTAENHEAIASLDQVGVYETARDRFVVIEAGSTLYASLIASTSHPQWTVNENAIETLSFIKSKTNVELGDEYKTAVTEAMEHATAEHKEEVARQLQENQDKSIKDRIAALTEKFKGDPVKLQLLASLAADYASISE